MFSDTFLVSYPFPKLPFIYFEKKGLILSFAEPCGPWSRPQIKWGSRSVKRITPSPSITGITTMLMPKTPSTLFWSLPWVVRLLWAELGHVWHHLYKRKWYSNIKFELNFDMGDVAPFFSFIFTFFKSNRTHSHVRGGCVL